MALPALFAVRAELRGELKPPRPYRDAADTPGETARAEAAAEGQTFLIEYEAVSGEVSLRAVTVQSVRVGVGVGGRRLGCYVKAWPAASGPRSPWAWRAGRAGSPWAAARPRTEGYRCSAHSPAAPP